MKKISCILSAACLLAACSPHNPVLTVEGGQIRGVPTDSSGVMVYKGIPYAAPPVGDLRWKAPAPVVPWQGVKVADTFSSIAPQPGNPPGTFYGEEFYWDEHTVQSEDCLYLNVWAPAKTVGKTGAKLPVAMWIHGGAFTNGYGHEVTMDGDAWAARGVILVTVNYRLGVLGFLSHPELTAEQGRPSGNYGLMDQIAALKWVRNNIAQFGGDPSRITIFGQSAGAMSVKNLLISPESRDLVAGAIIQSGGGLNLGFLSPLNSIPQDFYDAQGRDIMEAGGLGDLAAMRAAGYAQLQAAQAAYSQQGRWVMLSPRVDGHVLTEDFDHSVYDGSIADVPVMIGYNLNDMGMLAGEAVDRFCAVRDSLCDKPVFEYEFMRDLPGDFLKDGEGNLPGAFHSAELWYMFHTLKNSRRPFTPADYALSDEMMDAWTSFCKTGNPGWQEYKKDSPYKKEFDVK